MAITLYSKKVTQYALVHMLRIMIRTTGKEAFLMAMENEFCDLKGLVDLDEMSNLDVQLLETLNNPLISSVLEYIYLLHQTVENILLINDFDEKMAMQNQLSIDLAFEFMDTFFYEQDGLDFDAHIHMLFFYSIHIIFEYAKIFEHGGYDWDNEYWEFQDEYWMLGLDQILQDNPVNNKNAVLLYNLLNDLNGNHDRGLVHNR